MPPILDIADLADRSRAAEATAEGAALFYAFGNFCALAARPELRVAAGDERAQGPSAGPGRERHDDAGARRTGSSTGTAVKLPWSALVGTMADLQALGPIGFRGPAAAHIPDAPDRTTPACARCS